MKEIWLCGRHELDESWGVNGIFSTEEKAVARCKDSLDFVAPFNMDEEQPEEKLYMVGDYYPLAHLNKD